MINILNRKTRTTSGLLAAAVALLTVASPLQTSAGPVFDPQQLAYAVHDMDKYAGTDVGDVKRSRGSLGAYQAGVSRSLGTGLDILFLDTVHTGANSRAEIEFLDESVVLLGDHSELIIDEMIFEPGVRSRGVMTLTKGVFRMVSGQVNKVADGTLTIKTPTAVIGVRGTDFWGLQEENKLTMALIDNGIVEITGADGVTVTLDDPLEAVVLEKGKPTPTSPFKLTVEQLQEAAKTVTF